jgi:pimeloyl-ACP methyl ester carboxylesterase
MSEPTVTEDAQGNPIGFGSVTGLPDLPDGFHEQFASRYVDVDGVRLHVVVGGSGSPLLLISGWPQFWWAWRYVMGPLAERHTVIAVDPRGVGLSDRPAGGYDTATVAAELSRLMGRLGHRRMDVVGHDVGMWIAYAMAADDPAAVDRLAVIDAVLPGISTPSSVMPDTQREVDASWHFLFNRLAALNHDLVEGREEAFLGSQFLVKAATPTAIPRSSIDVYLRAQQRPDALRGSFAYYRALGETIHQNRQRASTRLTLPALAIGGAASRGDAVGSDLRRVADGVTAATIPECGHYVPEEAPEALLGELQSFLAA